jgi:LysM repeat protein
VHTYFRWLIGILIIVSLAGCTRRPPEPAPVPTDALTTTSAEPVVDVIAETPTPEAAATDEAVEGTPESGDITGVNAERRSETFQYTVEEGDSLSWIAEKFGTTTQVLRELNFLPDDSIQIGSVLEVPFVEGMTAEGAPTPTPGPFAYTVQQGDTLGSIAVKFNASPVDIIEANDLENPDALIVGSVLLIPDYVDEQASTDASGTGGQPSGVPTVGEEVTYIVQPGDSLGTIASSFGVKADAIATANNITNRNLLRAGQKLIIPGVTQREAAAARGAIHIVQSGETLSEIAAQYDVTVNELKAVNQLTGDIIAVGQELVIPGQ